MTAAGWPKPGSVGSQIFHGSWQGKGEEFLNFFFFLLAFSVFSFGIFLAPAQNKNKRTQRLLSAFADAELFAGKASEFRNFGAWREEFQPHPAFSEPSSWLLLFPAPLPAGKVGGTSRDPQNSDDPVKKKKKCKSPIPVEFGLLFSP